MEQFGIWNLLKTMINNSEPPSAPTPKKSETTDENTVVGGVENKAEEGNKEPSSPRPSNACEEYLLRHERLSHSRKR